MKAIFLALLLALLSLSFAALDLAAQAVPITWEYHPKWRQVLDQATEDRSWLDHIDGANSPMAIHVQINRLAYTDDPGDRWLAPGEFFRLGQGDCEDFAIAKYQAFKASGVEPTRMLLVIGKASGVGHAVLLLDGSTVFDSLTDEVYTLETHPTFKPIYGVNEVNIHHWQHYLDSGTGRFKPANPPVPRTSPSS